MVAKVTLRGKGDITVIAKSNMTISTGIGGIFTRGAHSHHHIFYNNITLALLDNVRQNGGITTSQSTGLRVVTFLLEKYSTWLITFTGK